MCSVLSRVSASQRSCPGAALPSADQAAAVVLDRRRHRRLEHGHAERRGSHGSGTEMSGGEMVVVDADQIIILCLMAPPAGASVAGQRLLPEVRAAVLLEHQANVGHQNPGTQTGSVPVLLTALPPGTHLTSSSSSFSSFVPAAPLQEVREGRVREVQLQTLHVSNHGLRVPRADLRRLLRYHQRRRVSSSTGRGGG